MLDGNQAVLIECKATRFSRAALTSGEESAVRDSLKQVLKGLRQLAEFRRACLARTAGLEFLENCTVFKPVLVTLEHLYLINSVLFRDYLDEELRTNGITSLPWQILSVNELEVLQPHLDHGLGIGKVLKDLEGRTFNTVLSELFRDTGLTYKDSFLYKTDQELYRRLGVADRIGGTSGSSIY